MSADVVDNLSDYEPILPRYPGIPLPSTTLSLVDQPYKFVEKEWFQQCAHWAVHEIPDPKDTDPSRNPILAGLTIFCVDFNSVIAIGISRGSPLLSKISSSAQIKRLFRTMPEWAVKVAPLPEKIVFPRQVVPEEKSAHALRKFDIYMEPQSLLDPFAKLIPFAELRTPSILYPVQVMAGNVDWPFSLRQSIRHRFVIVD